MSFASRVAEHAPLLLVYLDRELRVQFANLHCDELLGHPPEEVRGRLLAELVDAATLRYALAHVAELERGNSAPREYLLRDKSGAPRLLQVHAATDHDTGGRAIGYFACAQRPAHSLAEIIADALCELNPFAAERGVRIETRADAEDTRVSGDERGLRQTVARLLGAAVERSAAGAVVRVHVGAREQTASLAIYDQCPTPLPPGHLGLSISRAFVERLGGELSVSWSDAGAAIRVELPRLAPAQREAA